VNGRCSGDHWYNLGHDQWSCLDCVDCDNNNDGPDSTSEWCKLTSEVDHFPGKAAIVVESVRVKSGLYGVDAGPEVYMWSYTWDPVSRRTVERRVGLACVQAESGVTYTDRFVIGTVAPGQAIRIGAWESSDVGVELFDTSLVDQWMLPEDFLSSDSTTHTLESEYLAITIRCTNCRYARRIPHFVTPCSVALLGWRAKNQSLTFPAAGSQLYSLHSFPSDRGLAHSGRG
jgi:hypothetical protein